MARTVTLDPSRRPGETLTLSHEGDGALLVHDEYGAELATLQPGDLAVFQRQLGDRSGAPNRWTVLSWQPAPQAAEQ